MDAFRLPKPFTNTVKALYKNAHTVVGVNGIMSDPYQVTRGIRQGDPLSCPLFDLAIELLACKVRNNPKIAGIQVLG